MTASPKKALGFFKAIRLKGKYGWREKPRTVWSRQRSRKVSNSRYAEGAYFVLEHVCKTAHAQEWHNWIHSYEMRSDSMNNMFYSPAIIIWKPNSCPSLKPTININFFIRPFLISLIENSPSPFKLSQPFLSAYFAEQWSTCTLSHNDNPLGTELMSTSLFCFITSSQPSKWCC